MSRDGRTTVLVWIDGHIRGGAKGAGDGDVQGTVHTWPGEKAIDIKAGNKTITLDEKEYELSKGSTSWFTRGKARCGWSN